MSRRSIGSLGLFRYSRLSVRRISGDFNICQSCRLREARSRWLESLPEKPGIGLFWEFVKIAEVEVLVMEERGLGIEPKYLLGWDLGLEMF